MDGVDLAIGPGEVVGLLGANGAGKTTLIRMLLGLLPASAGQVRLFGGPPSRQARRRLGYVPQGLGLYDDLTPAENLAFTAAVFGRAGRAAAGPEAAPPGLPPAASPAAPRRGIPGGGSPAGGIPGGGSSGGGGAPVWPGTGRRPAARRAAPGGLRGGSAAPPGPAHPGRANLRGGPAGPGPAVGDDRGRGGRPAPGSWSPRITWTRPGNAAGWSSWRMDGWWPRVRRLRSPAAGGSAWSRRSRGRRRWTRWRRRACPPRWPGVRCGCPAPARPRWPAPSGRCRPGSARPRPPWKSASSSSRSPGAGR